MVLGVGALACTFMLQPLTSEDQLAHSPVYKRKLRLARLVATRRAGLIAAEREKIETQSPMAPKTARAPAAAKATATAHHSVTASTSTADFRLTCGSEPRALTVGRDVQQLRLSGVYCGTQGVVGSEIKNERNGFSATVFKSSAKSFTTDYMTLTQGENRIRIRHDFEGGAHAETELVVVRTPAGHP